MLEPTKKQIRLLVVDDSDNYSELIRNAADHTLSNFDLTIKHAESESEVLSILKSWDPTVVIMDAHTEAIDSLGALERYMAELVPVIMVSDSPSREIEHSSLTRGAVGYTTKSEGVDELESLLTQVGEVSINFEIQH
jgi:CheY-like chemotaxis protein